MRKLFKEYTGNIESNIILTAADLLGWDLSVLVSGTSPLSEIKKNALVYRIYEGRISVNTSIAAKISNDKFLTQVLLKEIMPYVTHAKVFSFSELTDELCDRLLGDMHTIVVKPIDKNNGVGVTTGISDLDSCKRALRKVHDLGCNHVLLEKHIETVKEYRIILWKGIIIDVLERIPAYVVGNGHNTVRELIEEKNAYRFAHFGTVFEPIIVDDEVSLLLAKYHLSLDSVLSTGHKVTVKSTCNLSQGGEVQRIDSGSIHPEYVELFKKVYQKTWLNYCGVDLITEDIRTAPVLGRTAINELNGGPGITLAFYDDVMTNRLYYGVSQILKKMESDPVQIF